MRYGIWVCVLMLSATSATAGMYRCKDAKGKTYFSDRACETKTYAPIKSGAEVPKLTEEEAKVKGGSMTVVGGGLDVNELESKMINRANNSIAQTRYDDAYQNRRNDQLSANLATKNQLQKEHADTFKRLEKKSGGDLSRCRVVSDGKQMISECGK